MTLLHHLTPVEHDITAIKQHTSECMQTSAAQVISYYDPSITVDDLLRNVPVYVENGEKIGTSPGHLAAYFPLNGFKTSTYIFDVELFDRTWRDCSPAQVIANLKKRQKYIPENSWLAKYHHMLVDGWEEYARAGGEFSFQPLSVTLLRDLLDDGPFLLMVSSTYLNQNPRHLYNKETDTLDPDPYQGRSLTHAVTCAGYREGEFLLVDPDPPKGIDHHRWIVADHLIASIMAAQTESDNLLIAVSK